MDHPPRYVPRVLGDGCLLTHIPCQVGVAVIDVLTGHYAQSAILAALYARKESGKGCKIDCSLFESAVASLANISSNWLIAGKEAQRLGSGHRELGKSFHRALL